MRDKGEIEKYLKCRRDKTYFYPTGDKCGILGKEEMGFLVKMAREYSIEEVKKIFEPDKKCPTSMFSVEISCEKCNKLQIKSISKSKLFEYLRVISFPEGKKPRFSIFNSKCAYCQDDERILSEKNKLLEQEQIKNRSEKSTENYIKNYLSPSRAWDYERKFWERWNCIIYPDVNFFTIEKYIKGMLYGDFLMTPYWKVISEKKKRQAEFKCQLCSSKQGLATHHRTYETHGREHENLQDLIVLCEDCHSNFHNKGKYEN